MMTNNYDNQVIQLMQEREKEIQQSVRILEQFAIKENLPIEVFDALAVAVAHLTMEVTNLNHDIQKYREKTQVKVKEVMSNVD